MVWWTKGQIPLGILGVSLYLFFILDEKNLKNKLFYSIIYITCHGFGSDYNLFIAIQSYFKVESVVKPILLQLFFAMFRYYYVYVSIIIHDILTKRLKISYLKSTVLLIFLLTFFDHILPMPFPHNAGILLTYFVEKLNMLPVFGLGFYGSLIYSFPFIFISFYKKEYFTSKVMSVYVALGIFLSCVYTPYNPYKNNDFLNINLVQVGKTFGENSVDFERFFELAQKSVRKRNTDLTILPENASPFLYMSQEHMEKSPLFSEILNIKLHSVLMGSSFEVEKGLTANAALFFKDNKKPEKYFKNKLFILGEKNIPLINSSFDKEFNPLHSGSSLKKFKLKDFHFATLICFEHFHDDFFREVVDLGNLDFISVLSNEVWIIEDNFAFFNMNILRIKAKEYSMNIVKSDLARYSMYTNYNGKIIRSLGIVPDILGLTVNKRESSYKTHFHKWGYWSLFLYMFCFFGIVFYINKKIN
jgi:apolipoprotein N-acyltransferase